MSVKITQVYIGSKKLYATLAGNVTLAEGLFGVKATVKLGYTGPRNLYSILRLH